MTAKSLCELANAHKQLLRAAENIHRAFMRERESGAFTSQPPSQYGPVRSLLHIRRMIDAQADALLTMLPGTYASPCSNCGAPRTDRPCPCTDAADTLI